MKSKIVLSILLTLSITSCGIDTMPTSNINNSGKNSFSVKAESPEVINSNDKRIKYEGKNWKVNELVTENTGKAEGQSATIEFSGGIVSYQADKGPDKGIVDVYIDGEYKASIDLFSEENVTETVFSSDNIESSVSNEPSITKEAEASNSMGELPSEEIGNEGNHTLSVITTGRKNDSSEGFNVNVKSFTLTTSKGGASGLTVSTLSLVSPTTPYQKMVAITTDENGNTYTSENTRIFKTDANGVSTLLAGSLTAGSSDGTGAAAQFTEVTGLKFDNVSNILYASDGSCIRKITPSGIVTTYAGSSTSKGDLDGNASNARFWYLTNMDIDDYGNLYVNDKGNNKVKKITRNGVVSTFSGNGLTGSVNGSATSSSFGFLSGMDFNSTGDLFVSDRTNNTTQIRKINPCGDTTTYSTVNSGIGGIAFDSYDNLFAGDGINKIVRQVTPTSAANVAGNGTLGSTDGNASNASFNYPINLSFDKNNVLNISDIYNGKIRQLNGLTTPNNVHMVSSIPTSSPLDFRSPFSSVFDKEGNLFVTDEYNFVIKKITPCGAVSIFAGTNGVRGHNDGTGTNSSFYLPTGIDIDSNGNIYVADLYSIRKITSNGVVSTLTGNNQIGAVDGPLSSAQFSRALGLKIDSLDNIYVMDSTSVRKIDLANGVVSTVAGDLMVPGNSDGPIISGSPGTTPGRFNGSDVDIDIDNTNNILYISEFDRIRKVDLANGLISTIAGSWGNTGDVIGPALSARFYNIFGISFDKNNNSLYIVDGENHKIKKLDLNTNIVSIYAAPSSAYPAGYVNGPASTARFHHPMGLTSDYMGNLYVTEANNSDSVRKIKK